MAFSWRKFTLFGFSIVLPAIAFLVKITEEQASAFAKHKDELRACTMCHKLFNNKAGVRLIMHLQEYHGFSEDSSIDIVSDLHKKLVPLIWKKK